MSLNASAFAALGSPDAVELLYDRDCRIVGLRPVGVKADNAHYVRRASPSPSGPWVVSAMAFLRFYDIAVSASRRWSAHLDGEILCVDLSTEGTPVRGQQGTRIG